MYAQPENRLNWAPHLWKAQMHRIEKRMDATRLRRLRGPPAAHFGLGTDAEIQQSGSQSVRQAFSAVGHSTGQTAASEEIQEHGTKKKVVHRPLSSHRAIDPSLFTRRGRRKMHEKRIALLPPSLASARADWGTFSSTGNFSRKTFV